MPTNWDTPIDEMGVLALYKQHQQYSKAGSGDNPYRGQRILWTRQSPMQNGEGLKKAFSIITSRRYDDDDYVILHEKDFGF